MFCIGIDSGSRALKLVLLDASAMKFVDSLLCPQGVDLAALAEEKIKELLNANSLERSKIAYTVATGYARNLISGVDAVITEITCHAAGVYSNYPSARTIIEIGGQDSKVIFLEKQGSVRDFVMNDKCAAGTGRFLEMASEKLGMELSGNNCFKARQASACPISSMCAVFAESEIIGYMAGGKNPEDIMAGVQDSIAARLSSMAGASVEDDVVFTGGVANVPGMKEAISGKIGKNIITAENPQFTGAYGAAVLAAKRYRRV